MILSGQNLHGEHLAAGPSITDSCKSFPSLYAMHERRMQSAPVVQALSVVILCTQWNRMVIKCGPPTLRFAAGLHC